ATLIDSNLNVKPSTIAGTAEYNQWLINHFHRIYYPRSWIYVEFTICQLLTDHLFLLSTRPSPNWRESHSFLCSSPSHQRHCHQLREPISNHHDRHHLHCITTNPPEPRPHPP